MKIKLIKIVIFQALIILILAAALVYRNFDNVNPENAVKPQSSTNPLLSPRIDAGVLKPRSFLISNFDPLESGISSFLNKYNLTASVYVENLRNGVNFGINEKKGYFPASLNKLPVAVVVLQEVEDKKLKLTDTLPIHDYEKASTSGELYKTDAKEASVKFLLEKMVKESDNTAFNVLYDYIDNKDLGLLLNYYGIKINLDYPVRKPEFAEYTDTVTPISIYNFFSSLYLSTVLNPQDSQYLLSLLADSDFDIKKLAGLPDNVTIAQKWGAYYTNDSKFFHDCGIMYIGQSRIFYCIMTRDLDVQSAEKVMSILVKSVYVYVTEERAKLDEYKKNIQNTT